MQLTAALPTLSIRLPHRREEALAEADPKATATASAKRAGGPQDRALYSCACGCAFTAAVSTSVGCPHCGSSQAW